MEHNGTRKGQPLSLPCSSGKIRPISLADPLHLRVLKDTRQLADRQSGRSLHHRLLPQALERLRGWLAVLVTSCTAPAEPCP